MRRRGVDREMSFAAIAPVVFSYQRVIDLRLSSRYGRRRHPILGYTRMHRGVDFAAPRGTPIMAAGNGMIVSRGRKLKGRALAAFMKVKAETDRRLAELPPATRFVSNE